MTILFTCIIDNYDRLKEVSLPEGWRAICFSNTPIESKTWEVIQVEKKDKIFRDIKIRPHVWLPEHDKSVWLDGNLEITIPLDKFIEGKDGFWLMKHPDRDCIYAEAIKCIELKKDNPDIINKQVAKYINRGFPYQMGLWATGCIIRDNNQTNKEFNDQWWSEVLDGSVRDQISFPVVAHARVFLTYIREFPFLQNIVLHPHVHRERKLKQKRRKVVPTKEYYRLYGGSR